MYRPKNRTYSHNKLKTWLVRNCVKCGKFLSLGREKYCLDCLKESTRESNRKGANGRMGRYRNNHPEVRELERLRTRVYLHSERFNIGDIV
jgi:hypothetical protein